MLGIKRKGWLRSPAILFVVFVTVLGLSGLVYAFWFTSLTSEGYVNTGNVQMSWGEMGTDDDGWLNNDPSGTDCDDEGVLSDGATPCPTEIWDMWEPWQSLEYPDEFDPGSSADPSSPFAETRYDKDVARCDVGQDWGREGEGSGNLVTWINNAYPSYYCTTYATAYNEGSIPVKATGVTMYLEKGYDECAPFFDEELTKPVDESMFVDGPNGSFVDLNGNGEWDKDEPLDYELFWDCEFVGTPIQFDINAAGYFTAGLGVGDDGTVEPELNGEIAKGILCGDQIDPGEGVVTSGWIHVNNAADQNMTYRWSIEQNFVNWNEWDDTMCTFDFGDPS